MEIEMFEDSLDYHFEPDEYFYEETIYDVWNNCILESFYSILNVIIKIMLVNCSFGMITTFVNLPEYLFHIFSALSGTILVLSILQSTLGKIVILICFTTTYFLIRQSFFNFSKYMVIVILFLCEYCLLDPEIWLEIRGIAMVFAMKLISLLADISEKKINFPGFFQYIGYIFCGGNIMFGPWINFKQYIYLYSNKTHKNLWWIFGVFKAIFVSLFFLTVSNCWTNYFLTESSNKFLIGYKEALTFRTSHYFICYLSEASILAFGFKNFKNWNDEKVWEFSVVKPMDIEFPASLPIVVANWNFPMHEFLKKYIYRRWVPLGKFPAIVITFVISSFLHGFEIKISVVLISIGIFHYAQIIVRKNISETFDICSKIFPCRDCNHSIKRNNIICRILLFIFSILTVIHLIFLGVLMDPSTKQIGILKKWNDLYFISFWIILLDIIIVQS